MKVKYYILNYEGTKWGLADIKSIHNLDMYKKIKLYDDNLKFIGIGLY